MWLCVTKCLQKWVKELLGAGEFLRIDADFFAALQSKLTMQYEGSITGMFRNDDRRWKSEEIWPE
jgi:hypothetical protein